MECRDDPDARASHHGGRACHGSGRCPASDRVANRVFNVALGRQLVTEPTTRTAADQRIARFVGWMLVVSTIGFSLMLFFVPSIAGFVALATWPEARIDACSPDRQCVISTMPVWLAAAALVVAAAATLSNRVHFSVTAGSEFANRVVKVPVGSLTAGSTWRLGGNW